MTGEGEGEDGVRATSRSLTAVADDSAGGVKGVAEHRLTVACVGSREESARSCCGDGGTAARSRLGFYIFCCVGFL